MSTTMTRRGPVAPRLYRDDAARDARLTGVRIARTETDRPRVTAKSFRLPSSGVQVDQERMASFASLVADATGRISAADRAAIPSKMTEFAQAMLDFHLREMKDQQQRVEAKLAGEWAGEQARQAKGFRDEAGKLASGILEAAHEAIREYGRVHGSKREARLRDALTTTGAGNHSEIIRAFAHFGRGVPDRKLSKEMYRGGWAKGDGDE